MTVIRYSITADENIFAFGFYAAIKGQSMEEGEYVMRQIEDFCENHIALAPRRGVIIKHNPETRRAPDKYGRTYYFEYYPEKDEVFILSIHKGDIQDLDQIPNN